MMNRVVTVLADPSAVASAAADRLVAVAQQAAGEGRIASIALAGGSTPTEMFDVLVRRTNTGEAIPWPALSFYWGDERAVPPDHPDSNYRVAREHLLDPVGIPEHRIFRMPAERPDQEQAALAYENLLRRNLPASDHQPSMPVFDLVYLGMGADGHTASLFPGTSALAVRDRAVVMHPVDAVQMDRMTLTFPVLNAARQVVIAVTGPGKADRVAEILGAGAISGGYPVQQVQPASGRLEWLLDQAAAAHLDSTIRAGRK